MSDKKQSPNAVVHELAPLYALSALDAEEARGFEEHLDAGCAVCETELRAFNNLAATLGNTVAAEPPAGLRAKLMSKVTSAPRMPGILMEQGGLLISRSDELAWQAMAPGIEFKPLYLDTKRQFNTCLVRMDAGARYPSHRHCDIEELFVLSGELQVEGQLMRAGDYCRADLGTVHAETFTDSGALFLLMASPQNELMT